METNHFRFTSLNGNKIITDASALLPEYIEGDVLCRKDVEDKIIESLKPILKGKRCENIFIYGPTGSGKTIMIKHVLDQLHNYSQKVVCVYINCWYHSTSMAIYTKIAEAVGETVCRRGRAADEIFDHVKRIIKQKRVYVLLVLDEIDGLMYSEDTRFLHNISRLNNDIIFNVVAIAEDTTILSKLLPRVRDSLRFTLIEIKGYNKEQLLELLKNRADKALVDGSYNNTVLEKIADIEANNSGNGRLVLEILWRATKKAEENNCIAISEKDVEGICNMVYCNETVLSREERIIVEILKTGEKSSTQIYWLFCKKLLRTKRRIQTYFRSLERKDWIDIRPVKTGKKIKYMFIKLKSVR